MSIRWPPATVGAIRLYRTAQAGQVLALFAIGVFVLLGAVGLGLDGSRTFEERRAAQTAVDHAATAAAFASCTGSNVATSQAAGQTASTANGFNNAAPSITVSVDPVVGRANTFKAAINSTIPGTFARVLGINNFTVSVEATAGGVECGAGGTGPDGPIFAGGVNCPGGSKTNVDISGNDHIVNGPTQTNGSFKNGGSNSDFVNGTDPSVEYVTTFEDSGYPGNGNAYTGAAAPVPTPTPLWPSGWEPGAQKTAMWDAYKNARVNVGDPLDTDKFTITTNGIYYSERTSDVTVDSIAPGVTSFTLVSKNGPLKISIDMKDASGNERPGRIFTPYPAPAGTPSNIIAVSGFTHAQPCDQFAIEKSGAGGSFDNAIMWAPNALVRWSGNEATLTGAVISQSFQLNGNEHHINGDPTLFQGDPSVLIFK